MTPAGPTSEVGTSAGVGTLSWGNLIDDKERVPELRWPRSVIEYDRMRGDSQVDGLYRGHTLPMRRYLWMIDPNGADASVVDRMSEDFGLPIKGQVDEFDDTLSNFSHDDHLRHALLSLFYGHMAFELVGEVRDGWWRLRKMAPRMPQSISKIEVEEDGGLKGIRQNITKHRQGINGQLAGVAPLIATKNGAMPGPLVMFTWEREGSNWQGRSMLRSLYANWLIKQRLIRVDATKHERTGMGIPIARAVAEGVGRQALNMAAKMAQKLRGGTNAGGALPFGMDMKLMGVEGNIPDTLASIKYHDESMARAWLMMFLQLGQTETGSRALGQSFIDFFALALEAVAHWYATTMTKHAFRRWVIWNVGENSPTPKLVFDPGPRELAVTDLKALLDAGAITVDPELEAWIRGKHGLPAVPEDAPAPTPTPEPPPVTSMRKYGRKVTSSGKRGRRLFAAGANAVALPDRTLRREPNAYELAAAVDFAQLEEEYQDAVDRLVAAWQDVRDGQINELVDIIAQTGSDDLAALSDIEVEAGDSGALIADIMQEVAESAVVGAVEEAAQQGVDVTAPEFDTALELLTARANAVAALLARSLSEAAARKATSLAGGALESDDIANEVGTYLGGLSDAYLEEQFTGVVAQAQNTGRRAVFEAAEQVTSVRIYASELLDTNTCDNCRDIDGKEYDSLAAFELDYPTGGYKNCKGGPKCRGTGVGVYESEEEPTVD